MVKRAILSMCVLLSATFVSSQSMSILFKDGRIVTYNMNEVESVDFNNENKDDDNTPNIDETPTNDNDYVVVTIDGITTRFESPKGVNFCFGCKGQDGYMEMLEFGAFELNGIEGDFALFFGVYDSKTKFLTQKPGVYSMPEGFDYFSRVVHGGTISPFEAAAEFYDRTTSKKIIYASQSGTFEVSSINQTNVTQLGVSRVGYTIKGTFDCTLYVKGGDTKKCNGEFRITYCP